MAPATVQRVLEVQNHPNADKLDLLTIKGWQVVAQKGLYASGDLVVYVEPDSLLPKIEEYAFIKSTRKLENGTEGYYVRTIKLRGKVSQGLVLPLKVLENFVPTLDSGVEGQDVSSYLSIIHYEKPVDVNMFGDVKGQFPSFGRKTDEERLQNVPEVLEQLQGQPYYITVKLDGTSASFYMKDSVFGVCSRNLELKEDANNAYWKIAKDYNLELKLGGEIINQNVILQGEIAGPSVQGNPLQLQNKDLFIFNVFDIDKKEYMDLSSIKTLTSALGLKMVPIVEEGDSFNYTQEQLLQKAKGLYEGTNNKREGIVVRSKDQKISFKVLNNSYLLDEK